MMGADCIFPLKLFVFLTFGYIIAGEAPHSIGDRRKKTNLKISCDCHAMETGACSRRHIQPYTAHIDVHTKMLSTK